MLWVPINMGMSAAHCQGISECLESGHPVIEPWLMSGCLCVCMRIEGSNGGERTGSLWWTGSRLLWSRRQNATSQDWDADGCQGTTVDYIVVFFRLPIDLPWGQYSYHPWVTDLDTFLTCTCVHLFVTWILPTWKTYLQLYVGDVCTSCAACCRYDQILMKLCVGGIEYGTSNKWLVVLCEYSKFRIESNSYFSIRFTLKQAQLFEIFEYLPSPISYLFYRMTPIFHLSNHA